MPFAIALKIVQCFHSLLSLAEILETIVTTEPLTTEPVTTESLTTEPLTTQPAVHLFLICGKKIGGSLFCGKIICGSPRPHQTFLPPNLPPTPHFSPLPHFFPPTNEENHR